MNIEIIEYYVQGVYPYERPFQIESFYTLEEAVELCEKLRKDDLDCHYEIVIDYKVSN